MISCAIGAVMKIELYERWLTFTKKKKKALYIICAITLRNYLFQDISIYETASYKRVWAVYREVLTQNNVGTSDNSSLIIIREYSKFNFIACQCTTSQYILLSLLLRLPDFYHNKSQTLLYTTVTKRCDNDFYNIEFAFYSLPLYFAKIRRQITTMFKKMKAKTTIKGYAFSREFNVSTYLISDIIFSSIIKRDAVLLENEIVSSHTSRMSRFNYRSDYHATLSRLHILRTGSVNREDLPPSIVLIRSSSHEREKRSTIITVPNYNQT